MDCVEETGEVDMELLQSFDYRYYPFDDQVVEITLEISGANLYTCNGSRQGLALMGLDELSQAEAQAALLPATMTWHIKGPPMDAVTLSHPIENGVPNPSKCTLRINVEREYTTYALEYLTPWHLFANGPAACGRYIVKRLISDILVVYMGLICGIEHPTPTLNL